MYSILFINLFVFYRLYYLYSVRKNCGQSPNKKLYFTGAGLSLISSVLLFLLIGDYLVIPGFISVLVFIVIEKRTFKKSRKEK